MTSTHRTLRDQRGFSLTEMLVAMAVLGVLVGGIFAIQQQGQAAYVMGSNRVETQQNARVVLDLLTRELRSAGDQAAGSIIAIGGPGDLTFMGACDPAAPTTNYQVRYQLSGTTLDRTCNGTTTPLVGGVQSFDITYWSDYNAVTHTGTVATGPNNARVVRVRLTTRSEDAQATGSMGDRRAVMESTVRLRNQ